MRLSLLRTVAPACACLAASHLGAQPGLTQSSSDPHEVLLAVTHVHVPSKVYHTTRDISVWLPTGLPKTGVRYAVLVFPDAEEKAQFRAALANIQFLVDRHLVPPIMVLGVPFLKNRMHELTPPATGETAKDFPAAGGADETLQFLADELLPWADAHYPTLHLRILAGHSAGGLLALYAMVARPDLFRVLIAMSPATYWNDGAFSDDVAARISGDTRHERTLFITSGGLENSVLQGQIDSATTAFTLHLRALLDSAHNTTVRFERRRYPNDAHDMTPLPSLVDGLRMAFQPTVVPIDSVLLQLTHDHTDDSAAIHAVVRDLESRYTTAATSLGLPTPFPEAPLEILGSYTLDVKQTALAVTLLRENLDRYPHSAIAHESLGEALAAAGDTSHAVVELRTAVSLAEAEMRATDSILVWANDRDAIGAARSQLQQLHQNAPASSG
jgi:predicted alpha/beta superfamily hydrolase